MICVVVIPGHLSAGWLDFARCSALQLAATPAGHAPCPAGPGWPCRLCALLARDCRARRRAPRQRPGRVTVRTGGRLGSCTCGQLEAVVGEGAPHRRPGGVTVRTGGLVAVRAGSWRHWLRRVRPTSGLFVKG